MLTCLAITMMTHFIFFVVFLASLTIASKVDPPKFPNIGYLGSTYNLFKGNPHSTKGLDPGFTLRNMFHYTYATNSTTADGRYSVPDGCVAVTSSACSFSFTSEITQSSSSYKDSLEVDVSASFKGWGASFSASADYKSVYEGSTTSDTKYVTSQAKCEAYAATVQKATLNPAFVNAVLQLPPNSTDITPYKDFFNHWGTHFAHNLRMGGRYGVRSSFSSSDFTSMMSSSLNIKASAGYSGIVSINANAATTSEKEQAQKFESYRQDLQIYQVGGKPPLNESVSSFEWAQTVKLNPLPLSYMLQPITEIMTPANFPDDKQIVEKQTSLKNSVTDYCLELGIPEPALCTKDQPGEVIKVHFVKKLVNACTHRTNFKKAFDLGSKLYSMGTMAVFFFYNTNNTIPAVEDSPLLANASDWARLACNATECQVRPICPKGFSHISDFICCDASSLLNCLATLPPSKPCIADKCLTECGWLVNGRPFGVVTPFFNGFGNDKLGNDIYGNVAFTRFVINPSDYNNRDLIKCLILECVQLLQD